MKKLLFSLVVLLYVCLAIPAYAQGVIFEGVMPEAEVSETDINSQSSPDVKTGDSEVRVDDNLANDVSQGEPNVIKTPEQYSNINDLLQYWEANGYPDYVGSVYSTDGSTYNLTVLLVNDDDSTREQILSSLADNSGVSFGKALYSHNTLEAVRMEIEMNIWKGERDENIYSIGVGWTSINGEVTGFGESGKEARVILSVDETVATEYASKFYSFYGDMVVVETGSAVIMEGGQLSKGSNNNNVNFWLWTIVGIFLFGTVAIVYFNRSRLVPAMQTNNGNIITGNTSISRKQTVAAIKNSALTPSEDVFVSITERIENLR